MRWGKCLYAAVILVLFPFSVNAAEGADASLFLMLDAGFTNRPVSLDLFENNVGVAWDEHALHAPTNLQVDWNGERLRLEFSSYTSFDPESYITIRLFDTETRVSPRSSIMITFDELAPLTKDSAVSPELKEEPDIATGIETSDESITLHLDTGFVGRAIDLELFGGEFTLSLDEHALLAPTALRLTRVTGGLFRDQVEAAKGIEIQFVNAKAVGDGEVTLTFKAHRPPSVSEQREVNTFADAGSVTQNADFVGDEIIFTSPAYEHAIFITAYREGIMRNGIASWYAYKECLCAASPDVPKGTRMKVSRADDPERFTVVTINDWGPERDIHPDRVIDLDKIAFERIGNPRGGLLAVNVEVVDPKDPLYAIGDEIPPPPWRW